MTGEIKASLWTRVSVSASGDRSGRFRPEEQRSHSRAGPVPHAQAASCSPPPLWVPGGKDRGLLRPSGPPQSPPRHSSEPSITPQELSPIPSQSPPSEPPHSPSETLETSRIPLRTLPEPSRSPQPPPRLPPAPPTRSSPPHPLSYTNECDWPTHTSGPTRGSVVPAPSGLFAQSQLPVSAPPPSAPSLPSSLRRSPLDGLKEAAANGRGAVVGAVVWGGLRTWRLRKVREGSGAPDRDPGPNLGPGSDTGGAGSLGRLRIRVLVERNPPAGLRALWGRGVATKCGLRGGVGGCGGGSGMWCVGRGSGWGRGWEGGGLTALCRSRRMESECLRDATAIGRGEWRLDGTDSLGEAVGAPLLVVSRGRRQRLSRPAKPSSGLRAAPRVCRGLVGCLGAALCSRRSPVITLVPGAPRAVCALRFPTVSLQKSGEGSSRSTWRPKGS